MKKIVSLLVAAAMCMGLCGILGSCNNQNVIYVYNWGQYLSRGEEEGEMDILAEFEAETGIKVVYRTFDHNEGMYAQLKAGASKYDLVIPSDYMIAKMIEEDMLEKIDYENIPNYKNIMEDFKGLEYDPTGEYSVPYTWGTVGLIYNTKMVTEPVDSWEMLWNEKYDGKILMFNNPRDAFGIADKKLGYSQNTSDETERRACAEELKKQAPLTQYVMDEIFDKMINGDAAIAPYYAGDYLTMKDENPDLAFVIPKEGTNRFVDAMCIPKGAQNKAGAEAFINFLLDPEIGLANTEYLGYSTPNQAVYELLDDEVKNDGVSYPSQEILEKCESFVNLPSDANALMQDLGNEVKGNK